MTLKEAGQILVMLTMAYPRAYKEKSKEEATAIVKRWHLHFSDMPAEIVYMALEKHTSKNKFEPTIAEIRKEIQNIHWEVYDAITYGEVPANCEKQYKFIYEATKKYRNGTFEGIPVARLLQTYSNIGMIEEKGDAECLSTRYLSEC